MAKREIAVRNAIEAKKLRQQSKDLEEKRKWRKVETRNLGRAIWNTPGAGKWGVAGAGYAGYQGVKHVAKNATSYDVMIILMLIFYMLVIPVIRANGMWMLILYSFIIIYVFLAVLSPSEKNTETYTVMTIITIIEFALPLFVYRSDMLMSNEFIVNYVINPQVTMLWFYFAVFRSPRNTWFSKLAYILVFLFWFGIALSVVKDSIDFDNYQSPLTAEQLAQAKNIYVQSYDWYMDAFKNLDKIRRQGVEYFKNQYIYAVGGDIYTGQVDEGQYENLGVFIEDIKPAASEFYMDDNIAVWATLKAKTLDDGLKINVSCYHGRKQSDGSFQASQKGDVSPEEIGYLYDEEMQDLDCRFRYGNLFQEGSNKVTFQADFNFETMAYIKTYFMDQDRLRSLTRQGIDPLEEYGIEDKSPVARYTNGPVQIGIGTTDPPIGIEDTQSVNPRLGITLQTNMGWTGKIKQLDNLTIMVPDSMALDTDWCPEFKEFAGEKYIASCVVNNRQYRSKQFIECARMNGVDTSKINPDNTIPDPTKEAAVEQCLKDACTEEKEGYNAYYLDINKNNRLLYTNIGMDGDEDKYKTFSCRLKINDANKLLGDSPIAIRYYRVKARYRYVIEEDTNVQVKESPVKVEVPKPTKTGTANVEWVYTHWKDMIANQCNQSVSYNGGPSSKLFDDEQECFCFMLGVINQESRGDLETVSRDGALGLMQVMPDTAKDIARWYGYPADSNMFDPATNLKFGYSYFHYLKNNIEGVKENGIVDFGHLAAAYNSGPGGVTMPSKCGADVRKYECLLEPSYFSETRIYVPNVIAGYEACKNQDLASYGKVDEVLNPVEPWVTESKPVEFNKGITITEKFTFNITDRSENYPDEAKHYTIYLYYGGIQVLRFNIDGVTDGKWESSIKYPFIRWKFNSGTVDVQYWKKTIINPEQLKEGAREPTPLGDQQKVFTDLWKEGQDRYVSAYYDNSEIDLYVYGTRFCTVPWSKDAIYRFCQEPQMVGLKVLNTGTDDTYAKAQFSYDPGFVDPCCQAGCNGCTALKCMSCGDICKLGDISDLSEDDLLNKATGVCLNAGSTTTQESTTTDEDLINMGGPLI